MLSKSMHPGNMGYVKGYLLCQLKIVKSKPDVSGCTAEVTGIQSCQGRELPWHPMSKEGNLLPFYRPTTAKTANSMCT